MQYLSNLLTNVSISLLQQGYEIGLDWLGRCVRAIIESVGITGVGIICFTLILKAITLPFDIYQRVKTRKQTLIMRSMREDLDKLQKQGLIIRERDPDCRRSCRISLTEAGREKAEAVRIGFAEIEQRICSGFREDEVGQLAGQLLRIKENLLK